MLETWSLQPALSDSEIRGTGWGAVRGFRDTAAPTRGFLLNIGGTFSSTAAGRGCGARMRGCVFVRLHTEEHLLLGDARPLFWEKALCSWKGGWIRPRYYASGA